MIAEDDVLGVKFNVSYHFERNLKEDVGKNRPCLMKRLGQEAVALSTSLPLSYKSSVFVRCDTDRLVVMKVRLILAYPLSTACLTVLRTFSKTCLRSTVCRLWSLAQQIRRMRTAVSSSISTFHLIIRTSRCWSISKRQGVSQFVSIRICTTMVKFAWVCWIRGMVDPKSDGIPKYPLPYRWHEWYLLESGDVNFV